MINIYRKIRKQLAAEDKLGKYLKYAIGEIVLVVIGILIALQINNWNETNNKKESAQLHLKTIKQNINEDLLQLSELNDFTDSTMQYAIKLTRQFQTIDTIDQFTSLYITLLILEKTTKPNKSGLETLNNSGELAYIPIHLQDLLLKYYNILDDISVREEISNTFIKIRYEPYYFEHYNFIMNRNTPWAILEDFYKDDPRIPREINETEFLADKQLEAIIFGRYFQIKQQNILYKRAIEIANQLLQVIDP